MSIEESLKIMQEMISHARGKMQKASFYFITWGWVMTFANLGMYGLLKFTDYPFPYLVWLIIIPAWIVTMVHGSREEKAVGKRTHLDHITMWLWIAFGIAVLPFVIFLAKINYHINPVVLVMAAIPTFLSGIMLKFTPLVWGGISFYVLGAICFLVSPVDQYLVGGLAIFCGYLIPGYLLKAQRENHA